jgi:NADH-quinone oxidoreductase subunit N
MTVDVAHPLLGTKMATVGLALIVAGMAFKISIVPFHLWTPDVYQGAPAPTTAFLSSASKVAAFAALMRIVYPGMYGHLPEWQTVWPILAAITLVIGNVIALVQEDVKRILAYSSIAHVGFMLMALGGGSTIGLVGAEGVLFYLLTYTLAAVGSFGVVAALPGDERGRVDLHYVRGLSKSHPWLAALFAVFLLSLAGVPPLIGFGGKLYAFRAGVDAKMYWLAVFAALNAAMAVYYYLRIIVRMYMESRAEPHRFAVPQMIYASLVVAAIGVVLLGLFPGSVLDMVRHGAEAIIPTAPAQALFEF